MGSPGLIRFSRWFLLVAMVQVMCAQDLAPVPVPAGPAVTPSASSATPARVTATGINAPASALRLTAIRFTNEKPVLGLPLGSGKSKAHCSMDGTAFFDLSSGSAGQELYGISTDGGVKHLLRKLPIDYTSVSVRDFFAGDQQLVTLLEAVKRDGCTDASPARETDYFVSLEDQAGDLSNLVQIRLRFKPVKIARFGAGDLLVLGWDEGNLLPMLALLKDDGTVRRFIDFDDWRRDAGGDGTLKKASEQERMTLESLQGAAFVAYGSEVMLTYPGTAKGIRVLSASGEARSIPIAIPAGYVLNDVLVSSGRGTLVLRVREAEGAANSAKDDAASKPKMRVLEMSSYNGSLLRAFVFDKPTAAEVTCAVNSTLSAVFYDTIPDANHSAISGGADSAMGAATQLVVSTVRR